MSKHERPKRPIPDWAEQERHEDMMWIKESFFFLWPIAQSAFSKFGRGAIIVYTTFPVGERGFPFGYVTQETIEHTDEDETKLLVREYEPSIELIVSMVKPKNRISSYRVRIPQVPNERLLH